MIDLKISSVWADATKAVSRVDFIEKCQSLPLWRDDSSDSSEHLGKIWDVAQMTTREMVIASGMTQAAFATAFCIPKRTVESWCMGQRNPPEYVKLLIALRLDLL